MSGGRQKADARTLFRKAKGRQADAGSNGPTASASGGISDNKYKGKSKQELLALLKMKQAKQANASASSSVTPLVPAAVTSETQDTSAMPKATKNNAAKKPYAPKRGRVETSSGGLTGLLGVAAADDSSSSSSSSDADGDGDEKVTDNLKIGTEGGRGGTGSTSSVPPGLPADFFDADGGAKEENDDRSERKVIVSTKSPGERVSGRETVDGTERNSAADTAPPTFDAARAAQLAAEAEAEEKDMEARLRAAGAYTVSIDTKMVGVTPSEDEANKGVESEARASNGAVLPEGFFDDPQVDAKTRGVDLKARQKEEEQENWNEFVAFAQEVKKTEQEEAQAEEEQEENQEQYEELEQATMMGRLATLMNRAEGIGRKRKRVPSKDVTANVSSEANGDEPTENDKRVGLEDGGDQGGNDVELSVARTGSAMREVAVATAPQDAAAAEISAILKSRKRKKRKEIEEMFSGEYVPMDPVNWRAKGR